MSLPAAAPKPDAEPIGDRPRPPLRPRPAPALAELNGWEAFWFSPAPVAPVARIRRYLAVLAAVLFVSHWSDIAFWFAADGVLSPQVFGRIVQSSDAAAEARWRWSPLFLTGSPLLLRAYLGLGVVLALIVAAGRGGRTAAVLLWLAVVGLANRSAVLAGLAELPLAFGLGYAAIAWPGPVRRPIAEGPFHWTAGLAQRLMQVHVSLWIAAVVATQLAGSVWWNGQAALALVGPTTERLWDLTGWFGNPLWSATVTHLLILTPIVALPLAWLPRTARGATIALIVWIGISALLSAQLLYGAVLAGVIASLLPVGGRPAR